MNAHDGLLYSVLDLSPILEGETAAQSFRHSLSLAQHTEKLGYHRYWVAEHHNIPGVASAATSVVIGHIAGGTSTIRVGSGGIMLPNHAPLVIAEQFGTLESLYPGRIDLGLGRAPGGDQLTARALRRGLGSSGDTFPADVQELLGFLGPPVPGQRVQAVPGQGLNVPLYLLGSSTFSATLAAELGLPFAFASHFAPELLHQALDIYRSHFQPSKVLEKPHVMIGVNIFAADTDEEARRLFTSLQQVFLNLVRGRPRQLQPPVDDMGRLWTPTEAAQVDRMTRCSAIGGPAAFRRQIEMLLNDTGADEIIATAHIYDQQARLRSFEIAAGVFKELRQFNS
ncbi:LLM class flavin-dependent oxidoreductase [Prosthecobacter vanneervenii]|uniref:Luciferase-like monooxygenase n=1 Tax=Prosthecobacter vanneervenii TaxID=48466 RepID=A0A7W7YC56_9BACT|nr:LLM class flavin-dependent oxidoreductase [Prosthecobacter vanneervenii]MBB5033312.1 luciferase family oxidoreductase group 1 [Prosthecobacter vanneervenii]